MKPKKTRTIHNLLSGYYLQNSLIEKVRYGSDTVDLTIDFCFWMHEVYLENEHETGIILLYFSDVTPFLGPSGVLGDYSIIEADYQDGCITLLLMDDFNNISYKLKKTYASGNVEINY